MTGNKALPDDVASFFRKQGFTVITTIDENGLPHNSCKGLVDIDADGRVYLLDLYHGRTYSNLKKNPSISVMAADEHKFKGFCLKGTAEMIMRDKFTPNLVAAWEKRINGRITQRILKEVRGEKGHHSQPEALLPRPAYLIAVNVEEIVNLTPHHIK